MSELCLVDISNNRMNFKELNDLAIELVNIALKYNVAVFFHSLDYGTAIIEQEKIKNYFLISDSFLYKNCSFLDTSFFCDVRDVETCRNAFMERFKFLNDIICSIFKYNVNQIAIYITTDISGNDIKDYIKIECDSESFLQELFKSIFIYADEYAYGFPTVKFIIQNT